MASDRELAIQEVRNLFPGKLSGGNDAFVTTQFPGQVMFAERAIKAERERDEAAQVPIAPIPYPSQDELEAALEDCQKETSVRVGIRVAINNLISRRNSPPKVDPLVEKIIAVQHRVRIEAVENCTIGRPDTVLREAEAIAAEVRKFAALESRLDAARA